MLRLVSVSLLAGALLASAPVLAQEAQQQSPLDPQQLVPQAQPEAPLIQPQAQPPAPQAQPQAQPQMPQVQPQAQQPAPQEQPDGQQPQAQGIGNQFCDKEFRPMLTRRDNIGKSLQALFKRPRPKTFEQAKKTFNEICGTFSTYIENDRKIVSYMTSNKDFCSFTDENVSQMNADLVNTQKSKARVCAHPPRQQAAPAPGPGGGGPGQPKPPVNLRLQ